MQTPRDTNGVTRTYRPDHNDFVDQMAYEYDIEEPDTDYMNKAWQRLKDLNISKKSMEFARLYYREGKTLSQTAAALKISAQGADSRHKMLKKEIRDRQARMSVWENIKDRFKGDWLTYDEIIICMYYKGLMTYQQIADAIGVHYVTINLRILKFNKSLKIS